ncbi:hypothetical protein [Comamonas sp. 4034]|uniref:hypothetical protein n=1 Tax=Comamonas sp. 4034 TaxID=3156455 RepID=UPI003D2410EF
MPLSERHKTVVSLWRQWRKNMRDLNDGWFPYYDTGKQIHLFYEYLEKSHPSLVDMPRENPYLQVKAWVETDLEL